MSDSDGGERSIHLPTAVLAGVLGILLTLFGGIIYIGGALKQVEVNSGRLDRLEAGGSVQVQVLQGRFDNLVRAHDELAAAVRSLPETDTRLLSDLAALKVEIAAIIKRNDRRDEDWQAILQRVSGIESRVGDMGAETRRLADRFHDHEQKDGAIERDLARRQGELGAARGAEQSH